jgi:hypothetical protein
MFPLLAAAALLAGPSTPPSTPPATVAAVLARRTGVPAADASALLSQLAAAFAEAGLPMMAGGELELHLARLGLADGTPCKGKTSCLSELGRQLHVAWVVMISLSELEGERSVGLELLEVNTELILERDALLLSGRAKLTAELVEPFLARALKHTGAPGAPPAVVAARGELKTPGANPPQHLLPPPPPPPSSGFVALPEPAARSHTRGALLAGAGGVLLAAGAVLLGVGLATNGRLSEGAPGSDGRLRSPLTAPQAQALAREATLELGFSGASALAGLGLGAAAVVTW